ncbi:hypothetical protein [Sorangium sp. So ce1151]|uniref:hypothetical protein n=1 Tax=Sorangium sp. So ce1151 TaxID=3133332 RepID=UPI003F607587
MPNKRDLLTHLTRDELLTEVSRFELPVSDRRARDQLIDAIVQARSADLSEVLLGHPRDRLKELCRRLGLDDHGKERLLKQAELLGLEWAA